jgi:hypothetical protein
MKGKTRFNLWTALGLVLALGIGIVWLSEGVRAQGAGPQGTPLGTAFTYQGRLTDSASGEPIAGPCDLRFSLYQSLNGNDPVSGASPQVKSGVQPSNGFFAVSLDFGADAFSGEARFVKIEVDCGSGWETVEVGGMTLAGTAGQPEPGPALSGGGYTLYSGFWPAEGAAPSGGGSKVYLPLVLRKSR